MSESLIDRDAIIYHEMMAHVPLFAHRKPQNVAILNDFDQGIVQEVLKHPSVKQIWHINAKEVVSKNEDARVTYCNDQKFAAGSLDAIIIADQPALDFHHYFTELHSDGILIQLCNSPFQLANLIMIRNQLKKAGFHDIQLLQFPQPSFTSGWRSAMMAIKHGTIRRPREKDIYNKTFTTQYYNLDVHRAAFALPEFMRLEWEI